MHLEKPYANEHSARLRDPGDFDPDTFGRVADQTIYGHVKVPETVDVIWAKLKEHNAPKDEPQPQALRFPVKDWTEEQARKWLTDNKVEFIDFEPALDTRHGLSAGDAEHRERNAFAARQGLASGEKDLSAPRQVMGLVKAVAPEGADWDIEVVCSTEVVDRDDEVIHQDGWALDNFRRNPVFLAAHMHQLADGHSPVIGSFPQIRVIPPRGLVGRIRFAATDLGREYKTLYGDGHMRAVSVGFRPSAGEWRDTNGRKVWHHTSLELYEVSAVAVGANPEALAKLATIGREAALDAVLERRLEALRVKLTQEITRDSEVLRGFILEQFDEIKALLPDDLNPRGDEERSDLTRDRGVDGGGGEGEVSNRHRSRLEPLNRPAQRAAAQSALRQAAELLRAALER